MVGVEYPQFQPREVCSSHMSIDSNPELESIPELARPSDVHCKAAVEVVDNCRTERASVDPIVDSVFVM